MNFPGSKEAHVGIILSLETSVETIEGIAGRGVVLIQRAFSAINIGLINFNPPALAY